MRKIDFFKETIHALQLCNLNPGDNIFLHSSLISALLHSEIDKTTDLCNQLLEALRFTIGSGTIGASSATWETSANNLNFIREKTPASKDIGIFSEYLRAHKNSLRTCHPVCSLVFNCDANCVPSMLPLEHRYAYGINSPWATMVKQNFKVVFLGLPDIRHLSLVHHIEQCVGVPYCYNKIFSGKVYADGKVVVGDFCFSVPYQHLNIRMSNLDCIMQGLIASKKLYHTNTTFGKIFVASMQDIFELGALLLRDNPYAFLDGRPNIIQGEIPMDRFKK